ncbi:hypothetical protein L1987_69021 [Smallanthus sonchifolius]|uniref:Uncharacterized protein n=1 Tax=Smallanthus sonchifolius TaxID=185202 RepID=A0ACB9B4I2_9ASTR|nr:hypothetical protein L1987_69021 [Smallanthus sonchifolius]
MMSKSHLILASCLFLPPDPRVDNISEQAISFKKLGKVQSDGPRVNKNDEDEKRTRENFCGLLDDGFKQEERWMLQANSLHVSYECRCNFKEDDLAVLSPLGLEQFGQNLKCSLNIDGLDSPLGPAMVICVSVDIALKEMRGLLVPDDIINDKF